MERTFEGCLSFIEDYLGIKLLAWQKDVLQNMYENKPVYYKPARGIGMTTLEKAVLLLAKFEEEDKL